jgi:hypothetical protein
MPRKFIGRALLGLVAAGAAFFVLAGLTATSVEHSGTVSNVLWVDVLICALLLILVAVAAVVIGLRRALVRLVRHHRGHGTPAGSHCPTASAPERRGAAP